MCRWIMLGAIALRANCKVVLTNLTDWPGWPTLSMCEANRFASRQSTTRKYSSGCKPNVG